MPRIRVLIVDDAVVMRRMITEAIGSDPEIEVVGVAANGRIALQKVPQVNPDIITMDVEMPEMDGLTAVRELRKTHRALPVIMFSTLTIKGAERTLEALAAGATDYVTKPANVGSVLEGIERLRSELVSKIKLHCRFLLSAAALPEAPAPPRATGPRAYPAGLASIAPQVFAIGCSTGGPNALADLFSSLREPLPVPCVIVQHMPPLFTKMLAERLGRGSPNRFFEGEEGQELGPGCAFIAPGGRHMEVRRSGPVPRLHLTDEPPENSCRPSVDVLFRSVAVAYGAGTLALVMTGMGQDGLRGCHHIQERGGRILAQDEATSVVWGMPGYVANAGLAEKVLPLGQIGGEVMRRLDMGRIPAAREARRFP
jgi:two-component system chemotaxis response regulator CheB